MRVDNRASIAFAAAPARSVRRGLVSPEAVVIVAVPRQSYKKSSAFGSRHQLEDSSAGYAPRQHPAIIVENAKALVLGTRQTRQHSEAVAVFAAAADAVLVALEVHPATIAGNPKA